VAINALWMAWIVSQSSFFSDDYLDFATARQEGLTWHYLTNGVFGHFVIGYRFGYWALDKVSPYNYTLACVLMVTTYALLVWVFSRVLVQLVGPRPGVPILTAAFGFSMLMAPMMLWWSAYLDSVPPMLGTLLTVYCFLRFDATRRPRFLVAMAIALAGGLAFWETALLAPVFIVFLSVIALDRGESLHQRASSLWLRWPAWVAMAIPSALFLLYYEHNHYSSGSPTPSAGTVAGSFLVAWFKGIGPTFAGINTCDKLVLAYPVLTILAGQAVFFAGLSWALLRNRRRALRALALFALSFVLYFSLEALIRSGSFGTAVGTNYLYLSSFAWLLALCASLAWYPTTAPRRAEVLDVDEGLLEGHEGPAHHMTSPRRWVTALLAALMLGLAVHGQAAIASDLGAPGREMRTYVTNFSNTWAKAKAASPHAFVFDSTLPEWLMPLPFYPTNLLSITVGYQVPGVRWSEATTAASVGYVAQEDGSLLPAGFVTEASFAGSRTITPAGQFCLPVRFGAVAETFTLAKPLGEANWFLRVSAAQGSLAPTSFGLIPKGGGTTSDTPPVAVGPHTIAYVTAYPGATASAITAVFPAGPAFCGSLAIGQPVSS
jgi:hypothetical protein